MSTRRERKELTHRTILDSAARLVRKRGIAGTGVSEVMQGARLTVGGFYAHFGSKADLVDDVLRRTGARLRETLFARLHEKPATDRAVIILKRYLSAAHRDLQTEGCPLPAVVGEIATTAPEHRDVLRGEIEALAGGVGDHLPGEAPLPRRQLALGLVALMYGGLALARALRGSELSGEILEACRAVGASSVRRV
jgi:TetR/AcrR family transcriptional regulator, transcriptional repressor for nem operon